MAEERKNEKDKKSKEKHTKGKGKKGAKQDTADQAGKDGARSGDPGSGKGGTLPGDAGSSADGLLPFSRQELRQALDDNERGDAELFSRLHKMQFVFCKKGFEHGEVGGRWLAFQGHRWALDVSEDAQVAIMNLAKLYQSEASAWFAEIKDQETNEKISTARAKELRAAGPALFKKRAQALQGTSRVNSIMKVARWGSGGMMIREEDLDQEPTLLPVANGVVDLAAGKLYPGRPEQFLLRGSPVEFQGLHVEAPLWTETLRLITCGDMELLDYIERCAGYWITGEQAIKAFWVAYGPNGNNGKSIFFDSLFRVFGDFGATINVKCLLEQRFASSGPEPDLLKIQGRRAIVASEAPRGAKFAVDKLKPITGGDPVSLRGLYAEPIEFNNFAKLILHSNFVPEIRGSDPAFHTRMRIIPFKAQFVGASEVDPMQHKYLLKEKHHVEQQLRSEDPGILAWVLRCAKRYLRDRDLSAPDLVLRATDDEVLNQDLIEEWLREACEKEPGHDEQAADLYHSFAYWAIKERDKSAFEFPNQTNWGKDMRTRFDKSKKGKYVFYQNIRLREGYRCPEDSIDWLKGEIAKTKEKK